MGANTVLNHAALSHGRTSSAPRIPALSTGHNQPGGQPSGPAVGLTADNQIDLEDLLGTKQPTMPR